MRAKRLQSASQNGVLGALAFGTLVLLPRLAAIERRGDAAAATSGASAASAGAGTPAAVHAEAGASAEKKDEDYWS